MPQELISQFDRKIAMPIETFRQVQTINLRDAIPTNIRWEGMIVYVISESLSYVLVGGVANSQWVDLGTLVDVTVRDNLTSTSTTDALSANQGRILKGLIDDIPTGGGIWGSITGTLSDQTDLQNALNGKEATISPGTTAQYFRGDKTWQTLNKASVGLGNVDNTSDLSKPISTLTQTALNGKQSLSQKGIANGYAPLDSGAKIPLLNLPDSILGQVSYQGTWNPSTNTPTLVSPTTSATKGHYYVCSASGTRFGLDFHTGDWVISNGAIWDKVDNSDAVTTVFGRIGNIVANAGDYTFAQIGSKPTTIAGYGITDFNSLGDARWVPLTRTLTGGDGIDTIGDLSANRAIAVDSTVVRTSGNQSIAGTKTFTGNQIILTGTNPRIRYTGSNGGGLDYSSK